MIDLFAVLDTFNWKVPTCIFAVAGALLIAFHIQLSDRYEQLAHTNYGSWGMVRRLSLIGIAVALLLTILYGLDREWLLWPPYAIVVLMLDLHMLARIMTIREDIRRLSAAATSRHHALQRRQIR
jgi:hypothetical protein